MRTELDAISAGFAKLPTMSSSIGKFVVVNSTGASLTNSTSLSETSGVVSATTAAVDTNTLQLATTAYVVNQLYLKAATAATTYVPLSSPIFPGNVTMGSLTVNGTVSGPFLIGALTVVTAESLNVTAGPASYLTRFINSNAATPQGALIQYTGASPNGTTSEFLSCQDSTAPRATIRSNGGLANYSANNVNLSDERLKKAFMPAASYYTKWQQIEFCTYLFKDQTDTELNLGVRAQQLEAVCPELVDNSGYGVTPADGVPFKAVYQTDFQFATARALQEAIAKIEQLTARVAALEPAPG
jgi:hypothetical protein